MLLVEQTRMLEYEANSIPTHYSPSVAATGAWATLDNFGTITCTIAQPIAWVITSFTAAPNYRLKVGNYYVFGTRNASATAVNGVAYLAAGNHIILGEFYHAATAGSMNGVQLGLFKLKDESAVGTLGAYAGQFTVNIPVRATPLGTLNQAVIRVSCFGTRIWAGTLAECQWANVADTLIGSVRLNIDGSQVNWTDRNQDSSGVGAGYAYYCGTISCGANHTVDLTKGTETTVHISIETSPWLLGTVAHSPVVLDFPPNSTLYTVVEPLNAAPAKNIKIGRTRCVTFGTASDYYSTNAAGTANEIYSYTFETVEPTTTDFVVSGFGGCISYIGCDIR